MASVDVPPLGQTVVGNANSQPTPAIERRRALRYGCNLEVFSKLIAQVDGDTWPAKVRNISVTGISLIVGHRLDLETLVNVELYNKSRKFLCQVPLRILYVLEKQDGNFIIGAAFTRELSQEELQGLL
ncbi:MAG TPA: PilZ domain-containing protein [Gemmataceae bacterium]|nr:PilZ domain-containing protein [Gemmataceae bacterium]